MSDAKTPPPSSTNAIGTESPIDKPTIDATAAVKEALDTLIRRASFGGGVDVDALDRILATAPIQDLRADFEDGYTHLGDAAEDADARRVGAVLAGLGGSPPRFGIRARGLEPAERRRGLQTLALVLDGAGGVPDGFVFTVPKVRSADQVAAIIAICQTLERAHGLPERSLGFELQIESPHIVLGADGTDDYRNELNGFGYIENGNFIYVYTVDEIAKIEESLKRRAAKVMRLNYLNATDAAEFVKPMLSPKGEIKASTTIVARYGIMARNWLGTSTPALCRWKPSCVTPPKR